jgi:RimJ/RimL family protein N-acetyltransferase
MTRCLAEARATGCRRLWVVTTNNNVAAIAFYQHMGMDLCALHRGAVRNARKLKPTLPVRDAAGIPIDHELEFELLLEV